MFINHQGQRKAKCVGSDKRVAVQVQKQLEAKLALGDCRVAARTSPSLCCFGTTRSSWLDTYVAVDLQAVLSAD